MSVIEARHRKGPPKGSRLELSDEERAARSARTTYRLAEQTLREDHAFWTRRVETEAGCWEWTGLRYSTAHGGYGSLTRDRHRMGAHRWAWMLVHGSIPDGLHVLHRCDNPPCFRPSHLFLGTDADNARDMASKGRSKFQRSPELFRGANHWAHRKPDIALAKMAYARSLRHVNKESS